MPPWLSNLSAWPPLTGWGFCSGSHPARCPSPWAARPSCWGADFQGRSFPQLGEGAIPLHLRFRWLSLFPSTLRLVPSCSLPKVLSENNQPLIFCAGSSAQTSVLVQSPSECLLPQILVQGSFPAGIVTQHSLFAWNKTIWVPPVDQIPTYSHCLMLRGLLFPSLLICFGNPACGWDPTLKAGRSYTAAPSLRLPSWIFGCAGVGSPTPCLFLTSLQAPHLQYFLSAFFFSGSFSSLVFCKLITSTVQC